MDANLNQWSKSNGDICHSDSSYSSSDWEACLQPIATWRKGGGSTFLPDHAGNIAIITQFSMRCKENL